MSDLESSDALVRRLAAASRSASLYSPDHPLVRRGVDALVRMCAERLMRAETVVIGFVGDDVVVDGARLSRSAATLTGFVRDLREREVEKITIARGVTRDDLQAFLAELADRQAPVPLPARLEQRGVRRVVVGRIAVEADTEDAAGIAAARRVYGSAVQTAEAL